MRLGSCIRLHLKRYGLHQGPVSHARSLVCTCKTDLVTAGDSLSKTVAVCIRDFASSHPARRGRNSCPSRRHRVGYPKMEGSFGQRCSKLWACVARLAMNGSGTSCPPGSQTRAGSCIPGSLMHCLKRTSSMCRPPALGGRSVVGACSPGARTACCRRPPTLKLTLRLTLRCPPRPPWPQGPPPLGAWRSNLPRLPCCVVVGCSYCRSCQKAAASRWSLIMSSDHMRVRPEAVV